MLEQVSYHGDNAVGKTVAKATLDYDTVRIIFTDGTFINAELRQGGYDDSGGIYNDEIKVKSNLDGGTTNVYEADQFLKQGIITQAEYDAFCFVYAEQSKREDHRRENRDRAEFNRLKARFGQ